jgi:hypothetical protein
LWHLGQTGLTADFVRFVRATAPDDIRGSRGANF